MPGRSGFDVVPRAAAARRRLRGADADRARRGGGPRAGPEAGRGRLPGEALRHGRAPRARRGAPARRRAGPDAGPRDAYRFGDVRVDFRRAEVLRDGRPVEVSAKELQLLRYFVEHRGAALSRDELLNEVWGYDAMPSTRTVDVHVAELRRKLEPDPHNPRYVVTAAPASATSSSADAARGAADRIDDMTRSARARKRPGRRAGGLAPASAQVPSFPSQAELVYVRFHVERKGRTSATSARTSSASSRTASRRRSRSSRRRPPATGRCCPRSRWCST